MPYGVSTTGDINIILTQESPQQIHNDDAFGTINVQSFINLNYFYEL